MDDDLDYGPSDEDVNRVQEPLLNHIVDIEVDATGAKTSRARYRYFLPVWLNGVPVKAMIDSGNNYANVMSEELMKHMNLKSKDLSPIKGSKTIGTARTGAMLQILGRVRRPLAMKVSDKLTFAIRPVVLRGLSMGLNLCGPFLQYHRIDQLHSEGCLRIDDVKLPLVAMLGNEAVNFSLPNCFNIYVRKATTIPPMSVNMVEATIPDAKDVAFPFDGCISGSIDFMEVTNLHPWVMAVNTCHPGGHLRIGMMNTLMHPVTVQSGQLYGQFQTLATPHCPTGVDLIESLDYTIDAVNQGPSKEEKR